MVCNTVILLKCSDNLVKDFNPWIEARTANKSIEAIGASEVQSAVLQSQTSVRVTLILRKLQWTQKLNYLDSPHIKFMKKSLEKNLKDILTIVWRPALIVVRGITNNSR